MIPFLNFTDEYTNHEEYYSATYGSFVESEKIILMISSRQLKSSHSYDSKSDFSESSDISHLELYNMEMPENQTDMDTSHQPNSVDQSNSTQF